MSYLLVVTVRQAKMAEPIEMLFGVWSDVWGPKILQRERAHWRQMWRSATITVAICCICCSTSCYCLLLPRHDIVTDCKWTIKKVQQPYHQHYALNSRNLF